MGVLRDWSVVTGVGDRSIAAEKVPEGAEPSDFTEERVARLVGSFVEANADNFEV